MRSAIRQKPRGLKPLNTELKVGQDTRWLSPALTHCSCVEANLIVVSDLTSGLCVPGTLSLLFSQGAGRHSICASVENDALRGSGVMVDQGHTEAGSGFGVRLHDTLKLWLCWDTVMVPCSEQFCSGRMAGFLWKKLGEGPKCTRVSQGCFCYPHGSVEDCMMSVSLPGDREPAAPVRAPCTCSLGAAAECLLFQVATECAEARAGTRLRDQALGPGSLQGCRYIHVSAVWRRENPG